MKKVILFILGSLLLASCGETKPSHKHVFIVENEIAPTCESDGVKKHYVCDSCGLYFDTNKNPTTMSSLRVPALGHDYQKHEYKNPTCEENGCISHYSCKNDGCDELFEIDTYKKLKQDDVYIPFIGHSFVDVEAKEPTCLEAGNKAYSYCNHDGCNCYFDINHLEKIAVNSWVEPKLNHDFKLKITGNYKTNYFYDTFFDKTGLVVHLVCGRENCHHDQIINSYSIIYENGGSCIIEGDSKVTIKYGNFSVDIPITVSLLENLITGMSDTYTTHCGQGIDISNIKATKGEVNVKYYDSEFLDHEITTDELIGGNTYYVVATSDGIDKEYQVAKKVSTLVVEHSYTYSDSEPYCIGYKKDNCIYCRNSVMSNEDIDLTKDSQVYGSNFFARSNEKSEGNEKNPNSLTWAVDEQEKTIAMLLPRVNFRIYKKVSFLFSSSSKDYAPINLGLTSSYDLYTSKGANVSGKINVTFSNGLLNISIYASDKGDSKVLTLKNANVSTGHESLRVLFNSKLYRSFYIKTIQVEKYEKVPSYMINNGGVSYPDVVNNNSIDITAYLTPQLTSENYSTVLSQVKDAGFTQMIPLLDGRSNSTNFKNALMDYIDAKGDQKASKLESLYIECDKFGAAIRNSNIFNLTKANEYGLKYYIFNEIIYDLEDILTSLDRSLSVNEFSLIYNRIMKNIDYLDNQGCAGLVIKDEPAAQKMDNTYAAIKAFDELKLNGTPYVNLLPFEEGKSQYDYEQYISKYMSTIYQYNNMVSVDIYPLYTNYKILTNHLKNYEIIANAVLDKHSGGEFKTFIYSTSKHYSIERASSKEFLLFQANAAIAYGSNDIQYFTYSSNTDTESDTAALVNNTTLQKNDIYEYAVGANKEISYFGKVLGNFDWKGVIKSGSCAQFYSLNKCKTNFNSLSSVSSSGNNPFITGCYTNGDLDAFYVMNYGDPRVSNYPSKIILNFDSKISHVLIFQDQNFTVKDITGNTELSIKPGMASLVIPF